MTRKVLLLDLDGSYKNSLLYTSSLSQGFSNGGILSPPRNTWQWLETSAAIVAGVEKKTLPE